MLAIKDERSERERGHRQGHPLGAHCGSWEEEEAVQTLLARLPVLFVSQSPGNVHSSAQPTSLGHGGIGTSVGLRVEGLPALLAGALCLRHWTPGLQERCKMPFELAAPPVRSQR